MALVKETNIKFKNNFDKAIKKSEAILIIANCTVEYSGRAEAFLDKGERIIIIKPDKTLIIHQPTGNAPVNYMKAGTQHSIIKADKRFTIRSSNLALKESIKIKILKLISFHSTTIKDCEKIQIFGTEKDMSDHIYRNPEIISKDFKPVSREEQTKYGFIDVFGHDKKNNLVVIECKRYKAGPNAPQQLRRYIEKLAKSKGISSNKIKGIVAAPAITKNAKAMLKELGYKFKRIEPPAFNLKHKEKQNKLDCFI
jgi:hypothetical protein